MNTLPEDHPLWLIDSQFDNLLKGYGAAEDNTDTLAFLRSTGLANSTVNRMHAALAGSECKHQEGMSKQRAEEILADWRQLDGSLCDGVDYVHWTGDGEVVLDSSFSLEFLKALVWWMENVEVVK